MQSFLKAALGDRNNLAGRVKPQRAEPESHCVLDETSPNVYIDYRGRSFSFFRDHVDYSHHPVEAPPD